MADYSIKPIRAGGVLLSDRWNGVTNEMIQKMENLLKGHMLMMKNI